MITRSIVGFKHKKFDLVHQTVFGHVRCGRGMRVQTPPYPNGEGESGTVAYRKPLWAQAV